MGLQDAADERHVLVRPLNSIPQQEFCAVLSEATTGCEIQTHGLWRITKTERPNPSTDEKVLKKKPIISNYQRVPIA